MHKLFLLILLPFASGCVAAAAGGAGAYLAYRESGNEPVSGYVDHDHAIVAEATIEALDILHDVGTQVTSGKDGTAVRAASSKDLSPRVFKAEIDENAVVVRVEAYDLGRTLVQVEVQTRLTGDQGQLARRVLDEIVDRSDSLAR